MNQIVVRLSKLHSAQQQIRREAKRFNIVDCGRRFGKTKMSQNLLSEPALEGWPVAYFSPTYKMLTEPWQALRNALAPATKRVSEQEKRIELVTGGIVDFWSLDNFDSVRGRKYKRIIVDEAAIVPNLREAWQAAIRPTLTDFQGDAWMFSTRRGHNFFWECYRRGLDPEMPDWACWQMPTSANPYIKQEEIEAARLELPERTFQQEYLALFLDDAGGVFRNVAACSTGQPEAARSGAQYVVGVDWAKSLDYSVFSVWDATRRKEVWIDRSNKVDYELQYGRLLALCERYNCKTVVAELNSIGTPAAEQLQRRGLPVQGFTTTNATKAAIIDAMALALEQSTVTLLADPVAIEEMQAYEMERLPSGLFRYGAPEGQHDDTVIARCLALYGLSNTHTGFAGSYDKRRK